MRFQILYHGERDFQAATYDEAHTRILDRHEKRTRACGFRISLSNYEVVDLHDRE